MTNIQVFVLPVQVSVLLPECSSAPAHLDTVFNSFNSFYLIRKLPVYELLDKHFLESAVYQGNTCPHLSTRDTAHTHLSTPVHTHCFSCVSGSVYGLSYRTRIDEDSCVALTPNGKHAPVSLSLSLQVTCLSVSFCRSPVSLSLSLCRSPVSLS